MKQVLCGDKKGYLIPKKVVENKLRGKFKVLKDKVITYFHEGYKSCEINYEPESKVEKNKDYVLIHDEGQEVTEKLVFKKELLNELFGLKGNITDISLKIVKNKTVTRYAYFGHSLMRDEEYLFNNKEVYYFFETKDYETENFCEMS